jgi:hypothetical protein
MYNFFKKIIIFTDWDKDDANMFRLWPGPAVVHPDRGPTCHRGGLKGRHGVGAIRIHPIKMPPPHYPLLFPSISAPPSAFLLHPKWIVCDHSFESSAVFARVPLLWPPKLGLWRVGARWAAAWFAPAARQVSTDANKSLYLIFVGVVFLSIFDCF